MRRVLVCALVALGCHEEEVARPLPRPTPRDAATVADAGPQRFTGVLTAAELVDIAPRVAGSISKVHVNVGDKVAVGDIVVDMDRVQLTDELRAAEAALSAASAAARQMAVDLEDARRKLALETKAVSSGISPTQNLDEARLGVKRAEAALERARSTQAAEAARAQAARDHVANASLRAPLAGTVAMRYRDAGNRVDAGTAIVRIVGHGKMHLRFAVSAQDIKTIAVGSTVTASIETVGQPVVATVKQISPTIDPASGMIIVEAQLETVPEGVQPGLPVWVTR